MSCPTCAESPVSETVTPGPTLIPGCGPGYGVTRDGRVWSRLNGQWGMSETWKELKPAVARRRGGYLKVTIRRGGGRRQRLVHELVLLAFVGPRPAGMECLHGPRGPADNRLESIRWGTRAENVADMIYRDGTHFTPFAKPPKATPDQVAEIRRRHAAGETTRTIAAGTGLGKSTVWRIIARKGVYSENPDAV